MKLITKLFSMLFVWECVIRINLYADLNLPDPKVIFANSEDQSFMSNCYYVIADVDGDSYLDVIGGRVSGQNVWFKNRMGSGFDVRDSNVLFIKDEDLVLVEVADIDSDGDDDLISFTDTPCYTGICPRVTLYKNMDHKGTFDEIIVDRGDHLYHIKSLSLGDMDGDGDLDMVAGYYSDPNLTWFENLDGQGTFGDEQIIGGSYSAKDVKVGDLDDDGDLDIVTCGGNYVSIYKNTDGFGPFELVTTVKWGGLASKLSLGDVDGDGDLDIMAPTGLPWSDDDDYWTYCWIENKGFKDSTTGYIVHSFKNFSDDSSSSLYVLDMDGDGDLDFTINRGQNRKVYWYENVDGKGTFEIGQPSTSFRIYNVGDFNSDGSLDLMKVADDGIYWYAMPVATALFVWVEKKQLGADQTGIEIGWSWQGDAGAHLQIDLYRNNAWVKNIRQRDSIWGNYTWTVPPSIEPGEGYQIRIQSIEKPEYFALSDPFQIDSADISKGYSSYVAHLIDSLSIPVLDGQLNDPVWSYLTPDSLLNGGELESFDSVWTDFADCLVTWKAVWCNETNRLYVALQVRDDVRGQMDNGSTGSDYLPSMDESIEFCTDGNSDGGEYWNTFGPAQYWRVTEANERDLLHYPTSDLYPSLYTGDAFQTAVAQGENGDWTCEAVFTIYNTYPDEVRNLSTDDMIGWDIWVNDSDNESQTDGYYGIDHQIGWNYKGKVWRFADFCGQLILGDLLRLPSIQVASMDSSYYSGDVLLIRWYSETVSSLVKIELTGGVETIVIVDSTENDGEYAWLIPETLEKEMPYQIKITLLDYPDVSDVSEGSFMVQPFSGIQSAQLPEAMALFPCYPNPFNPATTIPYSVSHPGHVRLSIYNVLGNTVRTLVDKEQVSGHFQVQWDGRNETGHQVSSGVFIVQMQVDDFIQRQKIMLLR